MKKITLLFFMSLLSFSGFAQLDLEDFEGNGNTLPTDWLQVNVAGPAQQWIIVSHNAAIPSFEGVAGTHAAYINRETVAPGTTTEDWLITPEFTVPNAPQLRFFSRLTQGGDQGSTYRVMINTAGTTDPDDFVEVQNWTELTINPDQDDYTEKIVDLPAAEVGNPIRLAFVMNGNNGDRWLVDMVQVVEQCLPPTNLGASGFGLETATLTWDNPVGATEFEVEVVGALAVPTGNGISYTDEGDPYVAGGLTEDTDYKFYVRTICAEGNESEWAGPFYFSTVALGSTCEAPIEIDGLSYSDTNNTAGYGDDYNGSPGASGCGTTSGYLNGDDVVYAYEADFTGVISVDLTENGAWSGIFVYDDCADIGVACVGGGIGGAAGNDISFDVSVTEGTTYYFVISTFAAPQTTPFTLVIQQVNCPPPSGLSVANVDEDSADLNWAANGATSWEVVVQNSGSGIPADAGTTTTDNTDYNVTATSAGVDFTEATSYEFYVRADCGDGTFSAWEGPFVFTTTQVPATMNYSQNFDGGASGFTLSNGTQTNKWAIGTATSNSPTTSLYISNDNGTTNAFTINATSVVHAYRDIQMPAAVDQVSVSFDWKNQGESCCDYLRVWLVPAATYTPTPGTLITAAASGGTQIGGNYNVNGNWTTVNAVVNAAAYSGQVMRVIFEWRNDGSIGTQPPAAVDNINIAVITCPAPSNLAISDLQEDEATFTWTAPTSVTPTYDYYFSTTNTAPTAGTTPTDNVSVTTATEDGLTPSTTYYFWVRSNCGPGDTSFWVGPVSFTTPQIPAQMDYEDDFDGGLTGWTLSNGTQTNQWTIGTATSNSPDSSLYITNDNGVSNAFTINATSVVHAYRDIEIPAGVTELNLSYDWKNVGESCCDYLRVWLVPITYTPVPGTLITAGASGGVQYGGNQNVTPDWTTANYIVDATAYAGTIRRLVFEWRNDGSVGTQPPAAVDNVELSVITCPQPIDLAVDDISQTEATVTWTEQGDAEEWEVIIVEAGEPAPGDDATGEIVDEETYTTTILSPGTVYEYYVRAICSDDDMSDWSGPFEFSTLICDEDQQCEYEFVLTDSFGDGWNGNTMTVSQNGVEIAVLGPTFTTGEGPVTITVPMCDEFPFELFWNSGGSFAGEVGISVINNFDQVLYTKPSGTGAQNTLLYTGFVDCDTPACLPVTGITVTNTTTTTAQIEWDGPTEGEWEYFIVPAGDPAPGDDDEGEFTDTNPATATGLEIGVVYDVYVRVLCPDEEVSPWAGPTEFNTQLCEEDEQCEYAFIMTDTWGDGWNGNTMSIRQNGITVATIGSTFTSGEGPVTVTVGLCSGIPFELFWNSGGFSAGEVGVEIQNVTYESIVYTKEPGEGSQNSLLYTGIVNCAPITCPQPTDLLSENIDYTSVLLLWTPGGTETQWEIVIQEENGAFPGETPATSEIVNDTPEYLADDLEEGVFYEYYVRAICGPDDVSFWSGPYSFSIFIPPGCAGVDVFDPNDPDLEIIAPGSELVICPGDEECIDLTANFFETGDTSEYEIESIDYDPPFPFLGGTELNVSQDDIWSPVVDLPFEFCFYGEIYSEAKVGSNGVVQFGNDMTNGGYCPWPFNTTIPNTGFPILNAIYGVYQDILPNASGDVSINYQVLGSYPCRALVVNYHEVPQFSCGTNVGLQTSQIVIYEISNVIEIYVENRTPCPGWQNGNGVMGIQNADGTLAAVPPGRNTGAWSASQEAWRFVPSGDSNVVFEWLQDGEFLSNETEINVCVDAETVMTARATYTNCNGEEIVRESEFNIRIADDIILDDTTDLSQCSNGEDVTFDLTEGIDGVVPDPSLYDITFYLTEEEATAGEEGTELDEMHTTNTPQTIWVRVADGPCFEITSFELILNNIPPEFTVSEDVTICEGESATLTVTPGNYDPASPDVSYTWTLDGGAPLAETGSSITVTEGGEYEVTVNNGGCIGSETITVTVLPAPVADAPADVTVCDSYTLPALSADNAYYTETMGGGVQLFESDIINSTQTIYVYATGGTPGCADENSFVVTIIPTPEIDPIADVTACENYTLPALSTGDYYTEANGGGTMLNANDVISTSQTVYVYAQSGTTPNCTAEESFLITIVPSITADAPQDVAVCDSYTLPALSAGNSYYTGPGGTGDMLTAGEVIIDTQTIYVYAESGDCTDENSFMVVIIPTPEVTIADGCEGNDYVLEVNFAEEGPYNADNVSFEWTTEGGAVVGGNSSTLVVADPGVYNVTVTPNGDVNCSIGASVTVDNTTCLIPRGISPNNDGLNDNFDLTGLDVRKLSIYNRYGQELFTYGNYTNQWYGQSKDGDELPTGTYFYVIERTNGENKTGWVYINRSE